MFQWFQLLYRLSCIIGSHHFDINIITIASDRTSFSLYLPSQQKINCDNDQMLLKALIFSICLTALPYARKEGPYGHIVIMAGYLHIDRENPGFCENPGFL